MRTGETNKRFIEPELVEAEVIEAKTWDVSKIGLDEN